MNATTLTGGKHGTKWIGGIMTALGIIQSVDPSLVPPSWAPYILAAGGIAAIVRGTVNTANTPPQAP